MVNLEALITIGLQSVRVGSGLHTGSSKSVSCALPGANQHCWPQKFAAFAFLLLDIRQVKLCLLPLADHLHSKFGCCAFARFLNQSRAALVLAAREQGLCRAPRWASLPLVLRVEQQAWQ
jgi:hypothetical protein